MNTGVDIREGIPPVGEEKIFVAVGNVIKENRLTLLWALENFQRKKICLLHVHQPAREFSILGGKFAAGMVDERLLNAHQKMEKEKMLGILNDYSYICAAARVSVEKIYIEVDNIEKGIVELILQHGITKLVMGAAANKRYSKTASMQTPWCCSPTSNSSSRFSIRGDEETRWHSLGDSSPGNELSMAKESKSLNEKEEKGKKEQLERERKELENFKSQLDQFKEELRVVEDQKLKLENQILDSELKEAELLEKKVISTTQQLVALQIEIDELQKLRKEREVAIQKEIDELQKLKKAREEEFASLQRPQQYFKVFPALEIESATSNFDSSMMIENKKFGNAETLRQTHVAIKKFRSYRLEGQSSSDFQQKVDILSKVRHQNIGTLIGVYPDASSIALEYLPNGSFEDRFTSKDGKPPLSWKTQIQEITNENAICTGGSGNSAGDWPLYKAKQQIQMASRCCEVSKDMPNLELEVWMLLLLLGVDIYK
ncbi:hypothetical protein NE237_007790 [Protea cynaroides]|uniref:RING-type E3 ubiquitin transferase n=1 Tax=Protea cynaroides TaxID=273540 RepID=A0A9Q0KQW6_9MAGN|nr:hypothetical protein NE237_007790 [Protea cynaroides]